MFAARLAIAAAQAGADPLPLRTADLYFACALEAHDAAALAHFEAILHSCSAAALKRLDPSPAFGDEVRQLVRQRVLLSNEGSSPQLRQYSGKGAFDRWLRAVVIGVGLNLLRRRRAELPLDDEALWEEPAAPGDPELDYIKERYRDEFKAALAAALAVLSARERTVLRLNLVAGLNIDEIGDLYRAHRATVARWIAKARETVIEQARLRLSERLKVSGPEMDSLLGRVRSQLEVSLGGLLEARGE